MNHIVILCILICLIGCAENVQVDPEVTASASNENLPAEIKAYQSASEKYHSLHYTGYETRLNAVNHLIAAAESIKGEVRGHALCESLYLKANLQQDNGSNDEADETYVLYILQSEKTHGGGSPDHINGIISRAINLLLCDKYVASKKVLLHALENYTCEKESLLFDIHQTLGYIHFHLEDYADSLSSYKTAEATVSDNKYGAARAEGLYTQIKCLNHLNKYDQVILEGSRFLVLPKTFEDNRAYVQLLMALTYYKMGNHTDAAKAQAEAMNNVNELVERSKITSMNARDELLVICNQLLNIPNIADEDVLQQLSEYLKNHENQYW